MTGNHGGHHGKNLFSLLQGIFFSQGTVGTERPHHLVFPFHRHTDKRIVLGRIYFFPGIGAIKKQGLLADPGNHHGPSRLNHPAGDTFPHFISHIFFGLFRNTMGHFNVNFPCYRIKQRNGPPNQIQRFGQDTQYPVKGSFHIRVFVQSLVNFIEQ